ncbi:MAG: enoyl-CoA hydratase/isomerase family protein [Firmicutes bacterium]|nr:enoyl-CoA hydratase/isomerase family protein [Bacillota bacterium]
MENYAFLNVQKDESGIETVTLNRPDKLNAWHDAMIEEFQRLAAALADDDSLRAVIITGAGRAFSAGEDVGGMEEMATSMSTRRFRAIARKVHDFFDALEALEVPVIAAINGVAAGGGLELALSCDFRIAGDQARMGFPEGNVGLIPGSGGISRLVKLVGLGRAKELVMLGEILPAPQALAYGLVHRVVPQQELVTETYAFAQKLLKKAPLSLGMAKLAINRAIDIDAATGRDLERIAQSTLLPTQDHLEGARAFLEKRPPQWQGR